MNELTIFSNEEFGDVRTILIDNEPWFVAADVCRALDIKNNRDALNRLDDDEKGVVLTDTLGGSQEMSTVNEAGLYVLVLGSRKPEAKAFKRWITHEVIPSIRKTGSYSTINRDNLSPELKMFYAIADNQARVEMEQKRQAELIAQIDTTLSNMRDIFTNPIGDWRTEINDRVREISIKSGIDYQVLWAEMYGRLENEAHCSLKRLQNNKKERMEKEGNTKSAIREATTKLAVISDKPKLKIIFENIVKEYAMRYCS